MDAPLHPTLAYHSPILHSPLVSLHPPHQPNMDTNQWGPRLQQKTPHIYIGHNYYGAPISVSVHPNHPHILLGSVRIFF